VRAPNWVGDVVMASPVLEAAVGSPRFGRVTIALRAHLAPVLSGGPCADHLLRLPRGRDEEGRDEVALLRSLEPDAALLLSNSFGAALRARLAGIPVRAGSSLAGRGLLLTHRVRPPGLWGARAPVPTQHLQRDVAGLLGIEVPSLRTRLYVDPEARAHAREDLLAAGLPADAGYVFCVPSAAFGAAKAWPPELCARALDRLHEETGLVGVVGGGPGEEPQMHAVASACQHPAVDLAPTRRNLETLKAVVEGAALALVGDSGPRWYASALGTPAVILMGPTAPQVTATTIERCRVLWREDLPCAPCVRRTCPLGHHACMRGIEVEDVVEAAKALLADSAEAKAC